MNEFDKVVAKAAADGANRTVVSEQKVMGGRQSEIITLEVTNNNLAPVALVLGTPAGIQAEQAWHPNIVAQIGAIATDAQSAALVTDNQGVGATFIQALTSRLVRNQMFVEAIEIVTADNAQRGNRLTTIEIPYNSATDSHLTAEKYIPVDTDYTGNSVLRGKGVILGEFTGVAYTLNVGVQVQINIKIGAVNSPSFVKCGC
jgi:hypothetical protein